MSGPPCASSCLLVSVEKMWKSNIFQTRPSQQSLSCAFSRRREGNIFLASVWASRKYKPDNLERYSVLIKQLQGAFHRDVQAHAEKFHIEKMTRRDRIDCIDCIWSVQDAFVLTLCPREEVLYKAFNCPVSMAMSHNTCILHSISCRPKKPNDYHNILYQLYSLRPCH